MKRHALGIVLVLLLAAVPVAAQFPGDTPDTIRFRVGGIFAGVNTTATFSTSEVPGAEVDFQKLLGLDDRKTTFRGDASWNFAGRSYLDFGFVNFDLKGSRAIDRDIVFGGVTYTAGAQVDSETLSRFISAAYRYGFVKNEAFQLGASLGVSYVTLRAKMSASAGVVGPEGPIVGVTTVKEEEINAPVPLLGLDFEARIAGPVSAGVKARGLGLTIDPYSGNIFEAIGHVDWYFVRNWGLGAAYEYTRIDIKKTTDTKTIQIKYRYDGPRLYLIGTF